MFTDANLVGVWYNISVFVFSQTAMRVNRDLHGIMSSAPNFHEIISRPKYLKYYSSIVLHMAAIHWNYLNTLPLNII